MIVIVIYFLCIAPEILPNQNHNLETGGFHCSNKNTQLHRHISTHSTKNLDLFKAICCVPWDSSPFFPTISRRIFLGHTLRSIGRKSQKTHQHKSTRYVPPQYFFTRYVPPDTKTTQTHPLFYPPEMFHPNKMGPPNYYKWIYP